MILPATRRQQILADVRLRRAVEVAELTRRFGVSPGTIRRDLQALARLGYLTRVHGGALVPDFDLAEGEVNRQEVG